MAVISGKGNGFFNSTFGIGPVLKGSSYSPERYGVLYFALRRFEVFESGDELIGPVHDFLRSSGHQITSSISCEPSSRER